MLQAFTRNYHDNSADAGFKFTFYCDICNDGYKSTFIESETYKKNQTSRLIGQGLNLVGRTLGGSLGNLGYSAERGINILTEQFQGQSPEWRKEHEQAFERCQNEAKEHFHRCPNCNSYVCDHCKNEDTGLCTKCSPRQEVYVAQTHSKAMKRNIDDAGETATVWEGEIESKTTICLVCNKPAGTGKFCNNCGASMELKECHKCGTKNALTTRFCNNCGENLEQADTASSSKCSKCGVDNPPGTNFCGECGNSLR